MVIRTFFVFLTNNKRDIMPTLAEEMRAIAEESGNAMTAEEHEKAISERLSFSDVTVEKYTELFLADIKNMADNGERFFSLVNAVGLNQIIERLKSHGFNVEDKNGLFIVSW